MENVLEAYIIYLAQKQKIPSGRWVRELAQVALLVTGAASKKPIVVLVHYHGNISNALPPLRGPSSLSQSLKLILSQF